MGGIVIDIVLHRAVIGHQSLVPTTKLPSRKLSLDASRARQIIVSKGGKVFAKAITLMLSG